MTTRRPRYTPSLSIRSHQPRAMIAAAASPMSNHPAKSLNVVALAHVAKARSARLQFADRYAVPSRVTAGLSRCGTPAMAAASYPEPPGPLSGDVRPGQALPAPSRAAGLGTRELRTSADVRLIAGTLR